MFVVTNNKLQTFIYICDNLTPKISLVRFKSYFKKYKSYNMYFRNTLCCTNASKNSID
jgi:hypothetical protein